MKMYYDKDADLGLLKGKKVAIKMHVGGSIGYSTIHGSFQGQDK